MYEERPAERFAGAVVWSRVRESAAPTPVRVLPDGCMDLLWMDGELLVAGPDTAAQIVSGAAGQHYTGLRFAPGRAAAVLGVAAWELRDQRVPLAALRSDRLVREWSERVADAADRGVVLELLAAQLAETRDLADPVPSGVLRGLRRGLDVPGLARGLALSERQLRRRCLDVFGYGPKTLDRVLRLGRALGPARDGLPFAQVATVAGYADQAHLAREVRALTGVPLGRLLADEAEQAAPEAAPGTTRPGGSGGQ
ncbi:helix-turn-helix domain-containing protein [Streptacidiphilus fuscans]|uniref:helix-turn-helix domain-containing protein n=1 Tax=Streptacidiphilus fuscans TaxID=2789292 RepID=UPI002E289E85|nr:helix-turn-helix domain-containing protein [Streptacidiphilus fuscans]